MIKHFFAVLALIVIVGCSTMPVNELTAVPVPAERIYAPDMVLKQGDGKKARVSFFRDEGFMGSACRYVILVNNQKAFAIYPKEYIVLFLSPGPYFFRLETTGRGLCPNFSTSQNTILSEQSEEGYRIMTTSGSLLLIRIK